MKITDSQQPSAAQKVEKEAEAKRSTGKKSAAAKPQQGDRIEISKSLDAELQAREAEQAKRVEHIKLQLQTGKYQVSSRDVAEKMLSRNSENEES
jgi:negative regulator of flagellin synthesis FlgM